MLARALGIYAPVDPSPVVRFRVVAICFDTDRYIQLQCIVY